MDWGLGVPDMSRPITRPPPSSRVVQFGTSAVQSFSDDLPLGDAVRKDATSATAIITRPKAAASPATRKPDIWPGCAFFRPPLHRAPRRSIYNSGSEMLVQQVGLPPR